MQIAQPCWTVANGWTDAVGTGEVPCPTQPSVSDVMMPTLTVAAGPGAG